MKDKLILQGVTIDVTIGVYDWEREKPQPLTVDLELAENVVRAGKSDNVSDALDYAAVIEDLRGHLAQGEYQLVEKVAFEIADRLNYKFGVKKFRVRVSKKPPIEGVQAAVVEIDRL